MKFRELRISQAFEFAGTVAGVEPGPWIKISARLYIKSTTPFGTDEQARQHEEWLGRRSEVGSISAKVTPLSAKTFAS